MLRGFGFASHGALQETEPPKGEEVVDAEIKSDDEDRVARAILLFKEGHYVTTLFATLAHCWQDVVLVTDGETATPSAQETEEAAAQDSGLSQCALPPVLPYLKLLGACRAVTSCVGERRHEMARRML